MQLRILAVFSFCILAGLSSGCQSHTHIYPRSSANSKSALLAAPAPLPILKTGKNRDLGRPADFEIKKKDPTLAELINLGLQNNPQTRISWDRIKKAKASLGVARSGYLPTVSGAACATRSKQVSGLTDGSYLETLYDASLSVNYTLFDFGERKWVNSEAKKLIVAATHHYDQTLQNIIQLIKTNYYTYLFELSMLQAKLADRDNALAAYEIALAKYESGVNDKQDSAMAKTTYMQAITELTQQKKQADMAMESLLHSVGFPFETELKLGGFGEIDDITPALHNSEALVDLAFKTRPDLKALRAQIEAKQADVRYKKAQGYPKVSASASVGHAHYPSSHISGTEFSAGAQISVPLFTGLYHTYKAKESKAELEEAKSDLEQREMDIIRDILDAEVGLKSASVELRSSAEYFEASKTSYEITLAKYKSGTSPLLDLIQAQTHLADARSQVILAKKNWFSSLTDLGHATGMLSQEMIEGVPMGTIKPKERPMQKEAP